MMYLIQLSHYHGVVAICAFYCGSSRGFQRRQPSLIETTTTAAATTANKKLLRNIVGRTQNRIIDNPYHNHHHTSLLYQSKPFLRSVRSRSGLCYYRSNHYNACDDDDEIKPNKNNNRNMTDHESDRIISEMEEKVDDGVHNHNVDAIEMGHLYHQQEQEPPLEAPDVNKIIMFAIPAIGIWLCGPILSLIDTSAVGLLSGTAQQAALNPAITITEDGALLVVSILLTTFLSSI